KEMSGQEKKDETPEQVKKKQKDKFIIMKLKETWEETENRIRKRRNIVIINIAMATFAVLFGIVLFYVFWNGLASNVFRIATSSIIASGGVLALLRILSDHLYSNKDAIISFANDLKTITAEKGNDENDDILEVKEEKHNNKDWRKDIDEFDRESQSKPNKHQSKINEDTDTFKQICNTPVPWNIVQKYIIGIAKVGFRMKTDNIVAIIESIEITKKQKDELRSL
ncbi:2754_t:CDS:2, partial [Racocetra fulgida]